MAYVIVVGNEKGGTGKSTISMHIIIHLLHEYAGICVGAIDVDARQGTLLRYIKNRIIYKTQHDPDISLPEYEGIISSKDEADDERRFDALFASFAEKDFIIIDTPGNDTPLSRYAHSHADLIITPINDSFIDLDMLVRIDPDTEDIIQPSLYAETVWEQKKLKAMRCQKGIHWIVLRNRMSSIYSKNKNSIEKVLSVLAKRIGFQLVPGFSERVIFRELFLKGLTLSDLDPQKNTLNMSHVAARQELLALMNTIISYTPFAAKNQVA